MLTVLVVFIALFSPSFGQFTVVHPTETQKHWWESIFWVNASYEATDLGLNLSVLCLPFNLASKEWHSSIVLHSNDSKAVNETDAPVIVNGTTLVLDEETTVDLNAPDPMLWLKTKNATRRAGLNETLLDSYTAIGIYLADVCAYHAEVLWLNTSEDAAQYRMNLSNFCGPYQHHHQKNLNTNSSDTNLTLSIIANNESESFETNVTLPEYVIMNTTDELALFGLDSHLLRLHRYVAIYFFGVCDDSEKLIEDIDLSQLNTEGAGPIGINVTDLGLNVTEIKETQENDTALEDLLAQIQFSKGKGLPSSILMPILNKTKYDKETSPSILQGKPVQVKVSIYVESMSNFDSKSMDFDLDITLRMAWREIRFAKLQEYIKNFDSFILIRDRDLLESLWLPDPFFPNSKETSYHEITRFNFRARITPEGLVLYEVRIKLKPSCNLILCKFPHDKQQCELRIQTIAFTEETLNFTWFDNNPIEINKAVELPELKIVSTDATTCPSETYTGHYDCIKAVFFLARDDGYYMVRSYIPTSLALMFSWVQVWLPIELMEARIGIAITVLLTISTESNGARESLPNVSYLKAIDLWFGFIMAFVFFTLLQSLFVVGFDRKATVLEKWSRKKCLPDDKREELGNRSERYHKLALHFDFACRVGYPLVYFVFVLIYFNNITKGRQDSCK